MDIAKLVLSISILSSLIGLCIAVTESKYVRINVDAKWPETSILLEASEFIASIDKGKFWKFVELFDNLENHVNDKETYEGILGKSAMLLSHLEVDMLKFALSTRSFSPKLEVYRQIIKESNMPDCDTIFSFGGKHFCEFEDLVKDLASSPAGNQTQAKYFDHIFPETTNYEKIVMVYGLIGSQSFNSAHKKMKELASNSNVQYVLRHHVKSRLKGKIHLSGYGVELAIKSTEYKAVDDQKVQGSEDSVKRRGEQNDDDDVEGFLFGKLRDLHPDLKSDLDSFKTHLKESNKELAELKVWQLQDLSFQAAQRVMSSPPELRLKVLRDISQNLPMLTKSLVKTRVNDELRDEIKKNQEKFKQASIETGDAALFINGLPIQVDSLDAFSLQNLLVKEMDLLKELDALEIEADKAGGAVAIDVRPAHESYAVDIRSESVQWVNDLEKDSQYTYWPSNLEEILRPTFPGMLRYIAKNIFHVVACINPVDLFSITVYKTIQDFVSNSMPARFGILFVADGSSDDDGVHKAGVGITRAFSFIKSEKSLKEAFDFVTEVYKRSDGKVPTADAVVDLFTRWYGKEDLTDAMSPNADYDDLRRNSYQLFKRLGLKSLPQVFMNGLQLSKEEIESMESSLIDKILTNTAPLQQATYTGHIFNHPTVYDYVMSQPNVVKRLNSMIQTTDSSYVKFAATQTTDVQVGDPTQIQDLSKEELLQSFMSGLKYFLNEKGMVTVWAIADADTAVGRALIRSSLHFILKNSKLTRLALVLCASAEKISDKLPTMNRIVQGIMNSRDHMISGVGKLLLKVLNETNDFGQLAENPDAVVEMSAGIAGFNKKKLIDSLTSEDGKMKIDFHLMMNKAFVKENVNNKGSDSFIVCNGRIIGPLDESNVFTFDDFELLSSFEKDRSALKIDNIVQRMEFNSLPIDGRERFKADMVMKINSVLSSRKQAKKTNLDYDNDAHSVIHFKPTRNSVSYSVTAVLDPLSEDAQKIVPILMALINVTNVDLRIFFNCKHKLSEIPLKRFYRYVLTPELSFDEQSGGIVHSASAIFHNMPQTALLTVNMDTPTSWLVEAVNSPFDLDNIHLAEADKYVYGDFELEYILVEGHCQDAVTGTPPRGLQFTLGTKTKPDMFDTIVMANLGYFQLKAFPGSFSLQLRDGRSSDIYKVDSIDGSDDHSTKGEFHVTVDSFTGRFLQAKVSRNAGKEHDDILGGDEKAQGLWDSITSYVNNDKTKVGANGTIHIFSVATGRLYERFLRIMMLTVLKQTKSPVKFWFLKNYLSSTFTNFLPYMSKEYKFDYELVQYQWPSWLHKQTDKQRIIWGYKILFLDVLFPLNLQRVIFVDADQVVRTDLKELMEMSLDGAPYAYTPFCNDRTEMDGFRFWKQGYWRSHLAGRPYHISALYVVDLKQFRKMAAGDRLRGQYQGLSQDPNSLANLDQDLPNNMIHQVPIKSLPQEWLWCETWCSDESKKRAKTIDLCNNPQTKEPKLQRALRIVEEWPELDGEIMRLQEKFANNIEISNDGSEKKLDEHKKEEL